MASAGQGNKNKKYGRSRGSATNIAYKMQQRKRTNKLKKLKRTIKHQPNNMQVIKRLAALETDYQYGERR